MNFDYDLFIIGAGSAGLAAVQCYSEQFKSLFFSLGTQDEPSFIKLVTDGKTKQILGIHRVGESASEIIQTLAVSIRLGADKNDFDKSIGIHPSSAEEFFSL